MIGPARPYSYGEERMAHDHVTPRRARRRRRRFASALAAGGLAVALGAACGDDAEPKRPQAKEEPATAAAAEPQKVLALSADHCGQLMQAACTDGTSVGPMVWSADHRHWHFGQAQGFEIRRLDADGAPDSSPDGLVARAEPQSARRTGRVEVQETSLDDLGDGRYGLVVRPYSSDPGGAQPSLVCEIEVSGGTAKITVVP